MYVHEHKFISSLYITCDEIYLIHGNKITLSLSLVHFSEMLIEIHTFPF